MSRSIYLGLGLLLVLTVLQATLFARFTLLQVTLQPALVVVVSWGLLRGPYEGLIWAFMAGILLDLFSVTPTGATALSLMATVLLVLSIQQLLPENPYLLPVLLCGLAVATHFVIYSLLIWLAQYGFPGAFLSTLPASTLMHAVLSIPVYWLLYYVDRLLYPRRIEV